MEENQKPASVNTATNDVFEAGDGALKFCAVVYGIYGLFLLFECLSFLATLHSPEPGFHATFDIVNVAFFMIDFIICVFLSLLFLMLVIQNGKKPMTVVFTILMVTIARAALIYFLYLHTEPKVHFVPYIYKNANDFSGFMRGLFLTLQLISGIVCTWSWVKAARSTII